MVDEDKLKKFVAVQIRPVVMFRLDHGQRYRIALEIKGGPGHHHIHNLISCSSAGYVSNQNRLAVSGLRQQPEPAGRRV